MMARLFRVYIGALLSPGVVVSTAAAIVVLSIAGPFGTFNHLEIGTRAVYWGSVVLIANGMALFFRSIVKVYFADRGFLFQMQFVSIGLTASFSPVLIWLADAVTGAYREVTPPGNMVLIVYLMSMIISSLDYVLIVRRGAGPGHGNGHIDAAEATRFANRLGIADPQSIAHVTANDHYIEVSAGKTKNRVLMRFADALAELDGLAGLQVHRSHWVAIDSVDSVRRDGGRLSLVLKDGAQIPVSRNFRAKVEAQFRPEQG